MKRSAKTKVALVAILGLFTIVATACGQSTTTVTLNLSGLETLTQGHYEGWAIVGQNKISTGKFNIGDSLSFTITDDISNATKIVITIEPEGDTDSVPSGIIVLAGDLVTSSGAATLAFPIDLSAAAGKYILATPTNGDNTQENSGIWYLVPPRPLTAGLTLPTLPTGWVYEGWVVNGGTPITSGRFTAVDQADSFNGFSDTQAPAPPFPGEDYLLNAPAGLTFPLSLDDGASMTVISVEPDLNGVDPTGDKPFAAKPLVAQIPAGAVAFRPYDFTANLQSIPSGVATVK